MGGLDPACLNTEAAARHTLYHTAVATPEQVGFGHFQIVATRAIYDEGRHYQFHSNMSDCQWGNVSVTT